MSSKWILESARACPKGTGTLKGLTDKLLLPLEATIVLVLDCLLSELEVRCSNSWILEVTEVAEEEEGKVTMEAVVEVGGKNCKSVAMLLSCRGARTHSGSWWTTGSSSIDNLINVAATHQLSSAAQVKEGYPASKY